MNAKNIKDVKVAVRALVEQAHDKESTVQSLKNVQQQAVATRKLSGEENKSKLMEVGMALVVFPEPTPVTPAVGACFIAGGLYRRELKAKTFTLKI